MNVSCGWCSRNIQYDGHFFFILMVEVHEWFWHHLAMGEAACSASEDPLLCSRGEARLFCVVRQTSKHEYVRRLEASWENSITDVERHAPKRTYS